jgi:hypothetical protein
MPEIAKQSTFTTRGKIWTQSKTDSDRSERNECRAEGDKWKKEEGNVNIDHHLVKKIEIVSSTVGCRTTSTAR